MSKGITESVTKIFKKSKFKEKEVNILFPTNEKNKTTVPEVQVT
jgi:hypothetical protein